MLTTIGSFSLQSFPKIAEAAFLRYYLEWLLEKNLHSFAQFGSEIVDSRLAVFFNSSELNGGCFPRSFFFFFFFRTSVTITPPGDCFWKCSTQNIAIFSSSGELDKYFQTVISCVEKYSRKFFFGKPTLLLLFFKIYIYY